MLNIFRKLINVLLLNSPYYFEDGSRISYLAQLDILRYWTSGGNPKILDLGLEFDKNSGLMNIESPRSWKWRDPKVPLNQNSQSGSELAVQEKSDLVKKLYEFTEKHPKKYKRVEANGQS